MKAIRKRIMYTVIVTLIVVFSSTFAVLMTLERNDYRNYLQGEYSKNMYELVNSVKNIRVNLSKSAIVGSKEQSIVVFEEIFRYASVASDKLNSIPVSQEIVGDTNKFLSQVGDFCYVLAKNSSEGTALTDKDYETIDRLKEEAFGLENDLNKITSDINEGIVSWGEIRKKVTGVLAKGEKGEVGEKFKGIQKQITQYPALIYDGPFSDNVLDIKPKISSQKVVTEKEAEEVARKIVGKDRVEKIEFKANEVKASLATYRFLVKAKGREEEIVCEISKNGGKVVYLIDNKKIGKATLDVKKAVELGSKYLESIGYKNMVSTYVLNYEDTAVISYIYNENNIVMYPDQIKLKVALDDGNIIGIESEKYLVSHEENRKIPQIRISEAEAKNRVGKRLEVSSVRLCIIPTETNKEALCYEFSGKYKDENFIVYINAENGFEQRIIQILNTPNGQLTM